MTVKHRLSSNRPDNKAERKKKMENRKSVSIENTDPNYIVQFQSDCLRRHNELRKYHGCRPLKFNEDLAFQAQDWAEYLSDMDKYNHSNKSDNNNSNNDVGENLAFRWYINGKKRPKGDEIADVWYNEVKDYSWEMRELNETRFAGHFTQMIWNASQSVGFGVAADGQGKVTVVAQYFPTGNVKGEYDYNVPPRIDGMIENFPEEGAAHTIPKGSRKLLDFEKNSSMEVAVDDSGNEMETLNENSAETNSNDNNNNNQSQDQNGQATSKSSSSKDEGLNSSKSSRSSSRSKKSSSNSSLSIEDVKFTQDQLIVTEQLAATSNNRNDQLNASMTSQNRIMLSLKRHQCTLDNLNMYSIKSSMARKEEVEDFFKFEMIYGADQQNLILDMLNAHNIYRKIHQCKEFMLSPELCRTAQEHAKKLGSMESKSGEGNDYFFKHSKNYDFGENIAIYQGQFTPSSSNSNYALFPENMAHEVTESWYNKKDDPVVENRYPYGQIVWKNSVLLGIGIKKISNSNFKEYAIVVNYYPPGNVEENEIKFKRQPSQVNKTVLTANPNTNKNNNENSNGQSERNGNLQSSKRSSVKKKKKRIGCFGCC